MKLDDGGPAFPRPRGQTTSEYGCITGSDEQDGMSLRDWFAGKALQGLVHTIFIDQPTEDSLIAKGLKPDDFPKFLAYQCYLAADAMLAERVKAGAK